MLRLQCIQLSACLSLLGSIYDSNAAAASRPEGDGQGQVQGHRQGQWQRELQEADGFAELSGDSDSSFAGDESGWMESSGDGDAGSADSFGNHGSSDSSSAAAANQPTDQVANEANHLTGPLDNWPPSNPEDGDYFEQFEEDADEFEESGYFHDNGGMTPEEELDEFGLAVKGLKGTSIPLKVSPKWQIFLGWSDRDKIIKGKLSLALIYQDLATDFVDDPRSIIDIDNFAEGAKKQGGHIQMVDSKGALFSYTSSTYIGQFSQAHGKFDMACYPFDRKSVFFHIALQKPGDFVFELELDCMGGINETRNIKGKDVVTKCTRPISKTSVGFEWGDFVCTRSSRSMINCRITGIRQWGPLFKKYMLPSLLLSFMGSASFLFSANLAMPRVATTMLALITIGNLRNQLMVTIPSTGHTSWLEEYFVMCFAFMFLNLLGHAASFSLVANKLTEVQAFLNGINLWVMLSLFWLTVLARLHVRQCQDISASATAALTAIAALVTVAMVLFFAVWHRKEIRRATGIILAQTKRVKRLTSRERADMERVVPFHQDNNEKSE